MADRKNWEDYKVKPFNQVNKFHLILSGEVSAVRKLKEVFMQQLNSAVAVEKELCHQHPDVPQRMTEKNYNIVCDLLTQCKDMYEIEALANFLFDKNIIPETHQQIVDKADILKKQFPLFDQILKGGMGRGH